MCDYFLLCYVLVFWPYLRILIFTFSLFTLLYKSGSKESISSSKLFEFGIPLLPYTREWMLSQVSGGDVEVLWVLWLLGYMRRGQILRILQVLGVPECGPAPRVGRLWCLSSACAGPAAAPGLSGVTGIPLPLLLSIGVTRTSSDLLLWSLFTQPRKQWLIFQESQDKNRDFWLFWPQVCVLQGQRLWLAWVLCPKANLTSLVGVFIWKLRVI